MSILVINVLIILILWALATIIIAGWCETCRRCIQRHTHNENFISHELIHTIFLSMIFILLLLLCLYWFPDALKTIVLVKENNSAES